MLTYLLVENLAVIKKASLDFGPGLNIITGETGAGKSVLVGALKFLMGERFNKATLRDSSLPLSVEATFSNLPSINEELKFAFDIEDEVVLSRLADSDAKNKVLINSKVAPVNKLKEVSEFLMDIHGQHEHQLLFNPKRHLSMIDYFIPMNIKNNYASSYRTYKNKKDELEKLNKDLDESSRLKDLYQFDINEIDLLSLDKGKDSNIDNEITFLSEMDKIKQCTATVIDILEEGEISAMELLSKSSKSLFAVEKLSPDLTKASDMIKLSYEQIEESVQLIKNVFDKQENSENELNNLIERKYKLANLYKKYSTQDIDVILVKREELQEKLSRIDNFKEIQEKLVEELSICRKEASEKAEILNGSRHELSKNLSEKIVTILEQLELNGSRFEVRFTELDDLDKNGGVAAEFYISTNKGFDLQPLASVASGGEISRVMLSLKEVFADSDHVETLLFDEIDTGISGKAAKSVAERLKSLSRTKQLIVITHLPVVAAMADSHFHIVKKADTELTTTEIVKLDSRDRETVLAIMMTGSESETSLSQARELIEASKQQG